MAENQKDELSDKKLRDYGVKRIFNGHRNKCPLTSVELVELYLNYLEPKNTKQLMDNHEFERFCCDIKRMIPKSKNEKLRGTGYLAMKEDFQNIFKVSRCGFNEGNKKRHKKSDGPLEAFLIQMREDDVGIEEIAKVVSVEENFLLRCDLRKYFLHGGDEEIPKEVCEEVFRHYDQNGSCWLSQTELMALLRDIFCIQRMKEEMMGKVISPPKEINELKDYADEMCIKFSTNLDGMLTYTELQNLLNMSTARK